MSARPLNAARMSTQLDDSARMSTATTSAPLRFAGYAALFDTVDRGGDVIRKGAFADTVRRWAGRSVPLLWQHKPDAPIGVIESIAEDARGLRVIGRVEGGADPAASLLAQGAVNGLSFGYRVTGAHGQNPRELMALDLVEVSLVTFPMQPGARVHAIEAVSQPPFTPG
jgi:uncharacterized protein